MTASDDRQRERYAAIYAKTSDTWLYPRTAGLHAVLLHLLQRRLTSGVRVLDVGCGAGRLSLYCARAGADVVGVDFSSDAVALARLGAEACRMDRARFEVGAAEEVGGDTFDLILLIGVLEHLPAPADTLRLLKRQLAPGGRIVAACPAFSNLRGFSYRTLGELFEWPMSLADLHQVSVQRINVWAEQVGLVCESTAGALFEGPWTAVARDMGKRVPAAARDAGFTGVLHIDRYLAWLDEESCDVGARLLSLWKTQGLIHEAPPVAELPIRVLPGLDETEQAKLALYLTLDRDGDMSWSDVEPVSLLGGETIYFLCRQDESGERLGGSAAC